MQDNDLPGVAEPDRRWNQEEISGDADRLATMATDDFVLVGPFGFVLDREQWLHLSPLGAPDAPAGRPS